MMSVNQGRTVALAGSAAEFPAAEFGAIFRQFASGHTLCGMKWVDFIRQTAVELAEVLVFVPSLADKRALSRLHLDNAVKSN